MIAPLFRNREGPQYPAFFYNLAIDMFAIVQHWEPPAIPACDRGQAVRVRAVPVLPRHAG